MNNNNTINTYLKAINKIEFFSEYIANYYFQKGGNKSNKSLELIGIFELAKVLMRLYKYQLQKSRHVFLSEDNQYDQYVQQQRINSDQFMQNFKNDNYDELKKLNPQQLKQRLSETLDRLKQNTQNAQSYNQEYEEELERSKKKIGIVSKLPLPNEFIEEKNVRWVDHKRIVFGELLFIIRPLIYCLFLIIYGQQSYKPYFISMAIDILRLIIQRKIIFYNLAEKQEFIQRNKDMIICYLFRDPFYKEFIKAKFITPLLNIIFGKHENFKNIALYFIEWRCSLSLLM